MRKRLGAVSGPMLDRLQESQEKEANLFARCLLMPERLIRKELKGKTTLDLSDQETPAKLAKTFDVEPILMTLRLAELGYYGLNGRR